MLVFKGVQPNGKPILSDHQTRDVFMDFLTANVCTLGPWTDSSCFKAGHIVTAASNYVVMFFMSLFLIFYVYLYICIFICLNLL